MTALVLPPDAPDGLFAWLVQVDPADADLAWIGRAERTRAARFADPARAHRYLAARARARALLAPMLGLAPAAIMLGHRDARPIVEERPDAAISLSYSGDWLAVALARDPVGIDVEQTHAHAADALVAATLPPAPPGTCFFDRWTAHEATHKALGRGLGEPAHPGEVRSWTLAAPSGLAVSLAIAGSKSAQD